MKAFMKSTVIALAIVALASLSAFAGDGDKVKSETKDVTLTQDVMVNGTLVKAGEVQIKFDEATNELSILRDGKLKAKTPAHVEARSEKAKQTAVRTVDKGGVAELLGVSFNGWTQDVMVGAAGTQSSSQ
jgi:hypothetical protein